MHKKCKMMKYVTTIISLLVILCSGEGWTQIGHDSTHTYHTTASTFAMPPHTRRHGLPVGNTSNTVVWDVNGEVFVLVCEEDTGDAAIHTLSKEPSSSPSRAGVISDPTQSFGCSPVGIALQNGEDDNTVLIHTVINFPSFVISVECIEDITSWKCTQRWSVPISTATGPPIILSDTLLVPVDGQIIALSSDSGRQHWTHEGSSLVPAADESLVWCGCDDGLVTALQKATGGVHWGSRLGCSGGEPKVVFVRDGILFAAFECGNGTVGVVAADSGTGKGKWSKNMDMNRVVTMMSSTEADVLIAGECSEGEFCLYQLSKDDGHVRKMWQMSCVKEVVSCDDSILVICRDGVGSQGKWTVQFSSTDVDQCSVSGEGMLYCSGRGGIVRIWKKDSVPPKKSDSVPFWKQWWFYFCCAFALVLLVAGLVTVGGCIMEEMWAFGPRTRRLFCGERGYICHCCLVIEDPSEIIGLTN